MKRLALIPLLAFVFACGDSAFMQPEDTADLEIVGKFGQNPHNPFVGSWTGPDLLDPPAVHFLTIGEMDDGVMPVHLRIDTAVPFCNGFGGTSRGWVGEIVAKNVIQVSNLFFVCDDGSDPTGGLPFDDPSLGFPPIGYEYLPASGELRYCFIDVIPVPPDAPIATCGVYLTRAKALSIRGAGTALTTNQVFAPGFPDEQSTFGGRCPVPSDWIIEFTGTGRITRLGRSEVVFEHCSRSGSEPGTFVYEHGVIAITAANGDELWGIYGNGTAGFVSPTDVDWQDDFDLTGGSGRFVGAWGSGMDWGTSHFDTGITEWEMNGVIVYDSSNRKYD